MILNREERFFRCFVCGVHGSLIDFIVLIEGITRFEAISKLEERKNYIDESCLTSHILEEKNEVSIEDKIAQLPNVVLPMYFRKVELDVDSIEARYLKIERGFSQELIDLFEVHYSEWEKRIIFPIRDSVGRLVAWQGRDVTNANKLKILTKPDGFKKSLVLYNFWQVIDEDEITLVEGPIDAIKAYQTNAVALFGKQISRQQLALLMSNKNLKRINLGLDPDAGVETFELASLLAGLYDVRIVKLPLGKKDLGDCSIEEATGSIVDAVPYSSYSLTLNSNLIGL